jgi:hypothetical protein
LSNKKLFNIRKRVEDHSNYAKLLDSSLVDAANLPEEDPEYEDKEKFVSSIDDVLLDQAGLNGAGMSGNVKTFRRYK